MKLWLLVVAGEWLEGWLSSSFDVIDLIVFVFVLMAQWRKKLSCRPPKVATLEDEAQSAWMSFYYHYQQTKFHIGTTIHLKDIHTKLEKITITCLTTISITTNNSSLISIWQPVLEQWDVYLKNERHLKELYTFDVNVL